MAQAWPIQLQQKLNEADFSETMGNTTIRSETEVGLEKVRRRFTRGVDIISCSVFLEKEDVALFKSFYNTTLNGGVLSFDFTDPFTDALAEFRFDTSSPPQITPVGGNTMNLRMNWERIP
jgi:hypothetical protein